VPTLLVHLGVSWLFDVEESKPVIAKLRQFVLGRVKFL